MDYKEKVIALLNSKELSKEQKEKLEVIFPELKESEDERIKDRLINYFYGFLDGHEDTYKVGGCVKWEGLDVKDVIAWLEKQGEQKPADKVEPKFKVGDTIRHTIHKYITATISDIKYGEYILSNSCGTHMPIEWQNNYELAEQKPAWSEEDEKALEDVRDNFEFNKGEMTDALIAQYDKFFEKIKSLRPQSQWKPSEEMLKALYRAIPENTMAISEDEMLLDKLYQGLKYGRVLSNK